MKKCINRARKRPHWTNKKPWVSPAVIVMTSSCRDHVYLYAWVCLWRSIWQRLCEVELNVWWNGCMLSKYKRWAGSLWNMQWTFSFNFLKPFFTVNVQFVAGKLLTFIPQIALLSCIFLNHSYDLSFGWLCGCMEWYSSSSVKLLHGGKGNYY